MKKKLMIVSGKARGGTWSPNVFFAKKKKKKVFNAVVRFFELSLPHLVFF